MLSNSAPPIACTTAPSTWLCKCSGLTIAPHSKLATARSNLHPPRLGIVSRSPPQSQCNCPSQNRTRSRNRVRPFLPLHPNALAAASNTAFKPLVLDVLQTKLQRIHVGPLRQLVHVDFAREVVRGRGQPAIRALAQRRAGWCETAIFCSGTSYGERNAGSPGVVVVKLPRGDACRRSFTPLADLDHAGGTEVGPGELLLARPVELHRLAGGLREPRGFDGGSPVCLPP